jgi:hypothetical protein
MITARCVVYGGWSGQERVGMLLGDQVRQRGDPKGEESCLMDKYLLYKSLLLKSKYNT